jgi:hypothetical protein
MLLLRDLRQLLHPSPPSKDHVASRSHSIHAVVFYSYPHQLQREEHRKTIDRTVSHHQPDGKILRDFLLLRLLREFSQDTWG